MTNAALHQIEAAANLAVRNEMIEQREVAEVIRSAEQSIKLTGSAYICGVTIRLSRRDRDQAKASDIRSMNDAAFERFACGV